MSRSPDSAFRWFVPLAIVGLVYFYLSTRYAIWNFDDLAFYGLTQHGRTPDLGFYFLGKDLPNEYRTYSLARVLQLQLMAWSGSSPYPLFAFMALIHLGSAALIYGIVRRHVPPVQGISSDALACALIWLFSPFSIAGTFHHFSYLLLPFFFLFAYILLTEHGAQFGKKVWYHVALIAALVGACLTGETVIAPLLAFIVIKLFQGKRWRVAAAHGLTVVAVLVVHYLMLKAQRPQGVSGQRFKVSVPDFDAALASFQQFGASVGSAILQGLQITTISFEPYYPGLPVHSFAWQHLSAGFFAIFVVVLGLVYASLRGSRPVASAASGAGPLVQPPRATFVLAVVVVVAASWSLYVFMMLAGARLYSSTFSLQIRYGYAVLPLSAIALYLIVRKLPMVGRLRLCDVAWVLPLAAVFFWLGAQFIANSTGGKQTRRTIEQLRAAKAAGVLIVSDVEQKWAGTTAVRQFGLMNPFVRWGDTPLQQDWTTANYLYAFLGMEIGRAPFIRWDDRYALQVQPGERPILLPLTGKFAQLKSRAPGPELQDYPLNDLEMSIGEIGDAVIRDQQELLDTPRNIGPELRLQKVIKAAPPGASTKFVFVWSDAKAADKVYIHFFDGSGTMVHQADHPFQSSLRLNPEATHEVFRIRVVEIAPDAAKQITRIAVGAYTNSPTDVHGLSLPISLGP